MKTASAILTLLIGSLMLAGCTIQPVTTGSAAEATATPVVEATEETEATEEAEATAEIEATAETTTDAVVEGAAVVTTTTSVMTTTVTTVTEGAVVSETTAVTPTDTADVGLLPTPTPAAVVPVTVPVTETVVVTTTTIPTTVVTDAGAGTILQIINSTPGLETLATALTASGMATGLDEPGPLTFFAPNNDAFAAIPPDQLNALLADPATLAPILQYHIVIDNVSAGGLGTLGAALSSSGLPITVTVQADGSLLINEAALVQGDIAASNGVIHIINGVLLPPATTP